jgi:hypothetical protein
MHMEVSDLLVLAVGGAFGGYTHWVFRGVFAALRQRKRSPSN